MRFQVDNIKLKRMFLLGTFALAMSGCAQDPQIIRETVPVISSKPYRYLKPSPKDVLTKGTLDAIKTHNETHWKVKQAEEKAAAQ